MPATYYFPHPSDPMHKDIPVWMSFYVAQWSTFNSARTRAAVVNNAQVVVSIPYPKELRTANSQNYTAGNMLNVQLVETGSMVGTLKQQLSATQELARSFLTGGSVVRFDHMETVLEPGARRTHLFNIDLIAKNKSQEELANDIALIFQTNCFPLASTQSLLTMRHPPIWYFKANKPGANLNLLNTQDSEFIPHYWDGDPLVSVLKSVDINRSPILNIPFASPSYRPIAINIKLTFIELEPAFQQGFGDLQLLSRAERFAGGARNAPPAHNTTYTRPQPPTST